MNTASIPSSVPALPLRASTASAGRAFVAGRRRRARRRRVVIAVLTAVALVLVALSLMVGHTFYGPFEVARAVLGEDVPGASFTVRDVRLPRVVLAVMVGSCFGLAGSSFQTMLGNPLASPDIIGISSGASAAAVAAIVMASLSEMVVSLLAVAAALATAVVIYALAYTGGVVAARLVLVGIAVSAMLNSVVAYLIAGAARWDLQAAMRWLTGSLNVTGWGQVVPVAVALCAFVPLLGSQAANLALLGHGDDVASALGVRVERCRVLVVVGAVALIAFATAAAGPIAFVAFLSCPIATRLVGSGGPELLPSALVGTVIVAGADLGGQWALGTRYPVGVVTGALGAPYLVYQLMRQSRAVAS